MGRPAQAPNYPPPGRLPLLDENDPVLQSIRETLYAALADVISANPGLTASQDDPSRTYFACTAMATLHFLLTCLTPDRTGLRVIGPHGAEITLRPVDAPLAYRPLLSDLLNIGKQVLGLYQEDDSDAINTVRRGEEVFVETRLNRLREELQQGAEYQEAGFNGRPVSAEGLVRQVANAINGWALKVCALSVSLFPHVATLIFVADQRFSRGLGRCLLSCRRSGLDQVCHNSIACALAPHPSCRSSMRTSRLPRSVRLQALSEIG
jgi:hypothetical protein